jgi:hypothetical protein
MEDETSTNYIANIKKAIEIVGKQEGSSTDEMILQLFDENNIERIDANKIIVFLPIAFCRRLLPNLDWIDEYFENDGTLGASKKTFSQTTPYILIWEEVSKYFSDKPQRDVILKIAGRSSEFHAINDLLNAGGKLEDIKLSPMRILW